LVKLTGNGSRTDQIQIRRSKRGGWAGEGWGGDGFEAPNRDAEDVVGGWELPFVHYYIINALHLRR